MKNRIIVLKFLIILFLFWGPNTLISQETGFEIFDDFPGGNIIVEEIDGDTIKLSADQRDTRGYWFYFYFKITGIAGKKVYFQFPKEQTFARFGPGYSINNDREWNWYGENSYSNHGFEFEFSENDTIAYFSNGFPYTQRDLHEFIKRISDDSRIRLDTLTYSKKDRPVEQINIIPSKNVKYKVLLTARNHANEMMTNYILEGIIESVLNEVDLSFLRDSVEFMTIPFVDKDGVEDGDQGKNRNPHDHNRDYDEQSIYPEPLAIMSRMENWSERKLKIVLDLHCPLLTGYDASHIFLIGINDQKVQTQEELFARFLEGNTTGDLKFSQNHLLRYGERWNSDQAYAEGTTTSAWGATIPGVAYSQTIEFPYANVSGVAVSKDGARIFGKAVAHTLQDYLLHVEENTIQD